MREEGADIIFANYTGLDIDSLYGRYTTLIHRNRPRCRFQVAQNGRPSGFTPSRQINNSASRYASAQESHEITV